MESRTIQFPNGNQARLVVAAPGDEPPALVQALGVEPSQPVVVCGGADALDSRHAAQLRPLLGRGVARAAAQLGAVIFDGAETGDHYFRSPVYSLNGYITDPRTVEGGEWRPISKAA